MPHENINELERGKTITGFYLVKSKRKIATRAGKPYLDLTVQDASGSIDAKVWEEAELLWPSFSRGDVIKVQAQVEEWHDRLQLKIRRLRRARDTDELDFAELLPTTERDPAEMMAYLREVVDTMLNPHLRALLSAMLADEKFCRDLAQSAAARDLHHSYRGGLLEHTWKLMRTASLILPEVYPDLDPDLVLAGLFLHDIGKIRELDSGAEIGYTKEGFLLGHLYLSIEIMRRYLSGLEDFPEELRLQLEHLLLSHHGEREWGSPVVPQTPEAIFVHHLDNLDAKTNMVLRAIKSDPNVGEDFTQFHRGLKRHFYKVKVEQYQPLDETEPEEEESLPSGDEGPAEEVSRGDQ